MESRHGRLIMGIAKLIVVLLGCSVLLACAYKLRTAPGASIYGIDFEALTRDQYVIMERTKGDASFTHILFLKFPAGCKKGLRVMETGGPATPGGAMAVSFGLFTGLLTPGSREIDAATYDALLRTPDADAILPLRTNYTRKGLWPIFWTTEATVQGKAIRIKTDAELGR